MAGHAGTRAAARPTVGPSDRCRSSEAGSQLLRPMRRPVAHLAGRVGHQEDELLPRSSPKTNSMTLASRSKLARPPIQPGMTVGQRPHLAVQGGDALAVHQVPGGAAERQQHRPGDERRRAARCGIGTAGASSGSLRALQAVADPADGLDEFHRRVAIDLLAQPLHVDVHDVACPDRSRSSRPARRSGRA